MRVFQCVGFLHLLKSIDMYINLAFSRVPLSLHPTKTAQKKILFLVSYGHPVGCPSHRAGHTLYERIYGVRGVSQHLRRFGLLGKGFASSAIASPLPHSLRLVGEPSPLIVPRIPHSTAHSLSVGSALHLWGVPLGRGGFRYYPTPTNSQPRGVSAPFYCGGVFTIAHAHSRPPLRTLQPRSEALPPLPNAHSISSLFFPAPSQLQHARFFLSFLKIYSIIHFIAFRSFLPYIFPSLIPS